MGRNRYDRINDRILRRIERVSSRMTKEFEGSNPFDKEKVDNNTLLYTYNTKGYEIFAQKAEREGMESAIAYRDEMEELKRRKQNASQSQG